MAQRQTVGLSLTPLSVRKKGLLAASEKVSTRLPLHPAPASAWQQRHGDGGRTILGSRPPRHIVPVEQHLRAVCTDPEAVGGVAVWPRSGWVRRGAVEDVGREVTDHGAPFGSTARPRKRARRRECTFGEQKCTLGGCSGNFSIFFSWEKLPETPLKAHGTALKCILDGRGALTGPPPF